jgi:hypothetical protein
MGRPCCETDPSFSSEFEATDETHEFKRASRELQGSERSLMPEIDKRQLDKYIYIYISLSNGFQIILPAIPRAGSMKASSANSLRQVSHVGR